MTCPGVGTAAAYIGSLFYMMKGASSCGLPDTEQTRGMVTSLWICCDCLGGYMGVPTQTAGAEAPSSATD